MTYLIQSSNSEGCRGQGVISLSVSHASSEVDSFPAMRLTEYDPVQVQQKTSEPDSLAVDSAVTAPSGEFPLIQQPLM